MPVYAFPGALSGTALLLAVTVVITVRRRSRAGTAAGRPPAPVFADRTGRRGVALRLAGYALGVLCLAYAGIVVGSMVGGPARPVSSTRPTVPAVAEEVPGAGPADGVASGPADGLARGAAGVPTGAVRTASLSGGVGRRR